MDSKRFGFGLISVLALALSACAGDSGRDETAQNGTEPELAQNEGEFPVHADLIDDIRNALNGGEGATTGGTGAAVGGTGIPPHGDPPARLRDQRGPYRVSSFEMNSARVYYPTNAPAPFAGMSLCGGFLNTGWEMTDWGEFYASWGIVTAITWTGSLDLPGWRGLLLAAAVADLKKENTRALSPLYQKMSDRYGTSGYSMGGGGSTQASQSDSSLKVGIGMAAWAPTGLGVKVPTLLMCGDVDLIAGCSSNSEWAYSEISNSVPKMWVMVGASHLSWFGPGVDWGIGGAYGLAFAKLFLEGDQRWKTTLLNIGDGWVTTNIR